MQAVDATAEGITAAQRAFDRATEPGPPAPFAGIPLTSLERNPFEGRPGPTAGEERQVPPPAPGPPSLSLSRHADAVCMHKRVHSVCV